MAVVHTPEERTIESEPTHEGLSIKTGLESRPLSYTTIFYTLLCSYLGSPFQLVYNIVLYSSYVENSRNIGLCMARPPYTCVQCENNTLSHPLYTHIYILYLCIGSSQTIFFDNNFFFLSFFNGFFRIRRKRFPQFVIYYYYYCILLYTIVSCYSR